ncbi:MAG: transglycosylase SLT domain-containing protein [Opitutaceae bacterium]|nr:transglycosylase SLT domain-containing protein [Opitutaceae bacterium]
MLRRIILVLSIAGLVGAAPAAVPAGAEAVMVAIGDQHSAYARTAQFVGLVAELKTTGLPLAVLIDGDVFEHGNTVARGSSGEIDYAMLAALARLAPTVLNLGNHEAEFSTLAETVHRAEAAGVQVVSNITDRATGKPFAPPAVTLELGDNHLVVLGLATDQVHTYREAVRSELALSEPVNWARAHWPFLLSEAYGDRIFPAILSHAGLMADRNLLPLVPDGTLFIGAHNHLQLLEHFGRTVYAHAGSRNESTVVAWLCRDATGAAHWEAELRPIPTDGPTDAALAALIQRVTEAHQTEADRAVIGHAPRALTKADAARWVAETVRAAVSADAVLIGNTTFGDGLPAGAITQAQFDACVRFTGAICEASVDGARLRALLAAANQGPDTPFAERRGEFQFAVGPAQIDPSKTYTIATTDWGAKNSARYFGGPAIAWRERPGMELKSLVRERLAAESTAAAPEPPTTQTATASPPSLDDLYDAGQMLFDLFAPEEIKEEYEFPSREQWSEFAGRLQQALQGDDVAALAAYEPEARAALLALRGLPGGGEYADWLEERLDYISAAKQMKAAPPTPSPSPRANAPETIPHLPLWRERMTGRAPPQRAPDLLPVLQKAFQAEGLPGELVWLAEVESSFNPAARSPVGARGLFQFMPETAKELGLSTWLPDERTDPEKSARAAARYLKKLHGQFGDWPLALAAYNAGPGRVRRTLNKRQGVIFADIASSLPAETQMYVPKVLATIEARTGIVWADLQGVSI